MKKYNIEITLTNSKKIRLCLEEQYAPKTVEHFVSLIKQNYFDGTIFHRIIENFMIQTGGYKIEDNTLYELGDVESIPGEFSSNGFKNDLKHELGVISMARTSDPNSATSQFFICAGTPSSLDGEYAAFGKTIDEASNHAVLNVASMPTMNIGGGFSDFPQFEVKILEIKVIEE